MTDTPQAYPLTWPAAWPRAASRTYSQFKHNGNYHSIDKTQRFLAQELQRLNATDCILSTNIVLRLDGKPRSDQRMPADPGVAVYFKLKGRPISLACDKWDKVACNIWAIAKHIESLRGQERWGIGTVEQAFRGYLALPAPMDLKPWWEVLGCKENDELAIVKHRWQYLAKINHPDNGGNDNAMAEVNVAWQNAKRARGWE